MVVISAASVYTPLPEAGVMRVARKSSLSSYSLDFTFYSALLRKWWEEELKKVEARRMER